jgi:hypothetical protein
MRLAIVILVSAAAAAAQSAPHYIGAGGCASSNCHGATTPQAASDARILGNEYAMWSTGDKHSRAFQVLRESRGKRMAEILRIADDTRDRRCTVCHVAGSPEKSLSDGVACEACHGSAEQWLGPHTRANSHEASVKTGMIDTRNLRVRANTCLGCHLGAPGQEVDHELIAAGHPDLVFELDTFTFAQPAHHRARAANLRVRAWAVGQSVALAQSMNLVAAHAEKSWPEFSDLECYQCHHDLRGDSWRIQRGYAGRKPGSLQLNAARFEVLRELVAIAAADQKSALEGGLTRISELVTGKLGDGAGIAEAARSVARTAEGLTGRFAGQDIDAQAVLRGISANLPRIANAGVNAAEQATMSLDALGAALGRKAEVVGPLYDYLEHPSTYRPADFIALYRKAANE